MATAAPANRLASDGEMATYQREHHRLGRWQVVVGFVAAALQVVSGAVHSMLGWPAVTKEFAATNAPAALVQGLAVPWHFTGLSMVTFGVVVALTLQRALRKPGEPLTTVMVIGATYVVFGLVGMALTGGNATFLMFLVPGVMLVVAAWRSRGA